MWKLSTIKNNIFKRKIKYVTHDEWKILILILILLISLITEYILINKINFIYQNLDPIQILLQVDHHHRHVDDQSLISLDYFLQDLLVVPAMFQLLKHPNQILNTTWKKNRHYNTNTEYVYRTGKQFTELRRVGCLVALLCSSMEMFGYSKLKGVNRE